MSIHHHMLIYIHTDLSPSVSHYWTTLYTERLYTGQRNGDYYRETDNGWGTRTTRSKWLLVPFLPYYGHYGLHRNLRLSLSLQRLLSLQKRPSTPSTRYRYPHRNMSPNDTFPPWPVLTSVGKTYQTNLVEEGVKKQGLKTSNLSKFLICTLVKSREVP